MAAENENVAAGLAEETKGKGKAVAAEEPVEKSDAMDEDEDSSDEEEAPEAAEAVEEEDGMEEIDLNNIVEGGRRTRGRVIDFAKAAEENPAEEDDDEDDDDFAADESKMDED
ncbi:histone chaperone domain CHZ [Colletotrichum lupini]|uniref:Histone chaperone domain CHZ n=2 Tax=Colletotrichum acutatum species complex TaxID=2707335 RepID=A0A9Q8SBR1_9PEZI|nr:histone chaperone domain CHZ [Colletotrichum lupini]XP_060385757.1 histone chaperone domain CHZ [Colletotrichum tamarilloi]KAK1506181.1 histone chaperone domain CHZ [Colletotrichum tamarilloi]KAK1719784.1 histone chaperone domain CHZ-domain-containing protein [Colletotrichum lupini]UQC74133.1 histone chaperone domain CHZ [Colletotrichum lupini]